MKKYKLFYICFVLFIIFTLSIGFSAFETNMEVSDIAAVVRIEENIRVTSFDYYSSVSNGISSYNEYAQKLLITNLELPNEDSTITYGVTITNYGNVEMGIYEFNGLPDNLTYEVSEYQMQDKICDAAANYSLGAIKSFYLTLKYKDDGYDASNTNYELNIGVDFREFHTITYKNITDNGFPAYIIDGGNLVINITDELEVNPTIYVDDKALEPSEYSYVDGTLTYNNVSGEVEVNGAYLVAVEQVSGINYDYRFSVGEVYTTSSFELVARYSDDSTKVITDTYAEPNRPLELTDTTLNVSYTENGITETFTTDIRVGYQIFIVKNSNSEGTCAVEINGSSYTDKNTVFVYSSTTIKFSADSVYINNQPGEFEFEVNSPMTIALNFADSSTGTTSIYAYTSWDFVAIPPAKQVVDKEFNSSNGGVNCI